MFLTELFSSYVRNRTSCILECPDTMYKRLIIEVTEPTRYACNGSGKPLLGFRIKGLKNYRSTRQLTYLPTYLHTYLASYLPTYIVSTTHARGWSGFLDSIEML